MEKRWKISVPEEQKVKELQSALSIQESLCRILVNRGIESFDEAREFFNPSLSGLHDPWLMKDMDKAVARIQSAISKKEKILVFGDYDVDGTTAVACMFDFLTKIHDARFLDYYIPHRFREGYGVSRRGIDHAAANGFSLIISLDCGIKSVELITYAQTLGIDFIVCDHHLPDPILPPAVAILNPKQPDCPYPFKELCGCGVGFKLISALAPRFPVAPDCIYDYLDLLATAIAADIVPMQGENRILAWYGLKKINESPGPGISALIQKTGVKPPLTISNVVFLIAPRVNAAGRMDDAGKAVQLFIEKDAARSAELADMLHTDNDERRIADLQITEEALAIIRSDETSGSRKSSVVYKEDWHKGVVGIVASRLIEHYYRPTVVLTRSGDVVTGSARSVPGFNLYEAIYSCRDELLVYGGHFAAAGLSLKPENVESFSRKFDEVVSTTIDERCLIPQIDIDAPISFELINMKLMGILKRMEPFGPGNLPPVFIAEKVKNTGMSSIVKDQHIRFVLRQGNASFTGIGFGMASKFHLLELNRPLDVVFRIEENEFNNMKQLQLKMLDFKLSEDQ